MNYSQLDKEGLAVIFGVKKFHQYVYGRQFTIVTEHKPLLGLLGEKKAIPQMASPRVQNGRHMVKGSISKFLLFVRISVLGKLRALFPLVASACLNNASFSRYL